MAVTSQCVAHVTGQPATFNRPPDLLVLIADRDADTRHMYAEYLRFASCDSDEAEDGREALAKALSRHPDVIVTDTRLPIISGYEVCHLLKHDRATRTIPIIVVTGDAYPADVARARSAGANSVLLKPCLPDVLAVEIRRQVQEAREPGRHISTVPRIERTFEGTKPSEGTDSTRQRLTMSRAHLRRETDMPPAVPPAMVRPRCDQFLMYERSHVGGVSERYPEQWDYDTCRKGCGTFQYRHRTRSCGRPPDK
jgi:CheY-like chemotaxis protein